MAYTANEFLNKIKPMVIADMKKTGILASLTAAQAFIESSKGNSKLAAYPYNNLFGIKGSYNGHSVKMLTTEYIKNKATKVYADFRVYPSWSESIEDHSGLFNRASRYKNLRGETNYITACKNVEKDGYATAEDGNGNPTYAKTLISTIEKYRLYEWDQEALTGQVLDDVTDILIEHHTLRKGDRSNYVKAWQIYLHRHGYSCGDADGIYGANTEKAVKKYQKDKGLVPDGIIGPLTWATVS